MFNLFKKKSSHHQKKTIHSTRITLSAQHRSDIVQALKEIGVPATTRTIATRLGWDSGSVFPRMTECVKLGLVSVAYQSKAKNGRFQNLYVVRGK